MDVRPQLFKYKDAVMLVLSRSKGESIRVGENIEIKVTEIGGGKVRLGITCPKDIVILRSELELTVNGDDVAKNQH